MKKTLIFLLAIVSAANVFSQDITGKWYGTLTVPGVEIPLVLHIQKTETGFSSTMDSPKQGAFGIPMDSTVFKNDSLFISSQMGISYKAAFAEEKGFSGKFHQNGFTFPLELTREKPKASKNPQTTEPPKRPQTPKKPYPYISKEVHFENKKAGITLAGTLTLPKEKGKFSAVVLISGSSPQNRNEEIFGHKPFLVLSDYLTRNGIAVLRYDDRGTAESEGNFTTATTADFATDAMAAVNYLLSRKEIDKNEIGLIGHSEGGMIAPMLAAKSDKIAFLVLLAAPGIPGDELLILQNKALAKASGMTGTQLENYMKSKRKLFQIITSSKNVDSLKTDLSTYFKKKQLKLSEVQIQALANKLSRPWMQFFLRYDPAEALKKINAPVLALNGGNDLQVPAEVNLNAIETALKKGGNKNVTTKTLPGLNHLFQKSETGLPSEYGKIEQTFSPEAMKIIADWIENQVR